MTQTSRTCLVLLTFVCFAAFCPSIHLSKKLLWHENKSEEKLQRINKKWAMTPWGSHLPEQISASVLEWFSCLSRLSKTGYSRAHTAFARTELCTVWLSTSCGDGGLCSLPGWGPSSPHAVNLGLFVLCMSTSSHVPLLNKALASKQETTVTLLHYIIA